MKRTFIILALTFLMFKSYSQDGNTTIGFMGGVSPFSNLSATYGAWVDYGKWGGSIIKGAALTNEDPTAYIYGNAEKYTAGRVFTNIGVHRYGLFKAEEISIGGGIQKITDINTNGFEKAGIVPYFSLGVKKHTIIGVFKLEGSLSKNSALNFGWGFNF